jgi:hypothetical protein
MCKTIKNINPIHDENERTGLLEFLYTTAGTPSSISKLLPQTRVTKRWDCLCDAETPIISHGRWVSLVLYLDGTGFKSRPKCQLTWMLPGFSSVHQGLSRDSSFKIGFEVLKGTSRIVELYSLVEVYRRFWGTCCIHYPLMTEAVSTSQMSVNLHHATRRDNPEDGHLQHL